MKRSIVLLVVGATALALVDLSNGQLNLPDMPGPPYPDKWGNNRWGVKYDPRVHGRGREHSAPSSPSGYYGGEREEREEVPQTDYRNPSPRVPTKTKWSPGLKPLVSSFLRRPSPLRSILASFSPTRESSYRSPTKTIDRYVKNYMNTYNSVAKVPASSDLINIQTFQQSRNRPTMTNNGQNRFGPKNFAQAGSRPSYMRSESELSDMAMSFVRTARSDSPSYRTVNPQTDFFPGAGPQISKKTSGKNFAKTLSKIYNDYKAGDENSGSASSDSISLTRQSSDDDYSDLYPPSDSAGPPPPPPSRPRGLSSSGPVYVEKPFNSKAPSYRKRPSRGPPPGSRRPPPSSLSSYSSGSPLSSLDLFDDSPTYSSSPSFQGGSGPSSGGPFDSVDYSDSPMIITSSGGGNSYPSSSGPMTVTTYSMSGPPPISSSSPYSSPFSSGPGPYSPPLSSGPGPYSPPLSSGPGPYSPSPYSAPPPPPPPSYPHMLSAPISPIAPLGYAPPYYAPQPYPHHKPKKYNKSKRNKKHFQHTPMNVLRGLLGRGERRERSRDYDREFERDEPYQQDYAAHIPLSLPPPPQYSFTPISNGLPPDYLPARPYSAYPPPPPPSYPAASPLSLGILSLRDSITGYRDLPPYRSPPPPPPSRTPPGTGGDGFSSTSDKKEKSPPPGHITQHLQDWPRIFTAMGSSVDAVAGGIHAVRKEISKMTGQTIAKGVMMSGSAVNEVSKGVGHMIMKMSTI